MMNERELAELVMQVLNAQKQYFKSRSQMDLVASKQLEARLRKEATAILEDRQRQTEGAETHAGG